MAAKGELPPAYDTASQPSSPALLKPATLYIAERFIHSSDPNAPPLYELSHSIGFLKDSDRKVVIERLDYTVRQNAQVATRKRALWDLTHRTPGEIPTYAWQAEMQSSHAIGHLGMEIVKPKLFGPKAYHVEKASKGGDRRLAKQSAQLLFSATPPTSNGEVVFEWADNQGSLIAREVERDDLMGLVIGTEMSGEVRDALVASWIMRIWWDLSRGGLRFSRRQHVKKIMGQKTAHASLSGRDATFYGAAGIMQR